MGHAVTLTAENFNATIEENDIVLVDYWAEWCGPCRMFGPIYEEVAQANPDIVFGKVDTEAEQGIAAAFQIRSIPTLMIFRDQILLFSQPGALPKHVLEDLVRKTRELDMNEVRRQIAAQQAASAPTT
jgi:thioredoxin 1